MNNLAELLTVSIDSNELASNWYEQIKYSDSFVYDTRNYVPISFFNNYFQNLITTITDEMKIAYKNIILQVHDKSLVDGKYSLNITHKDADRISCLTVPLVYNKMEPIRFYDDSVVLPSRKQQITAKPEQVSAYSNKHPTLVNVNKLHNVRVINDDDPRILLQLSFDQKFDDIIKSQTSKWRILDK